MAIHESGGHHHPPTGARARGSLVLWCASALRADQIVRSGIGALRIEIVARGRTAI